MLILISNISVSQEIISINNVNDIVNIKNQNAGKVFAINFWASWCKPCVNEFPALVKLNKNYNSRNFNLIFISLDFKEEVSTKLLPFLKINDVDYTTYYLDTNSPEEIMDYLNKKWDGGIPATFIFDKSGKLQNFILGEHSYEFFEKEIQKLI
jgi:thiol-disulfide isomerase/thioredoxin